MLFSVIIPVYNVEKYLRECVDSVLNQTYTNFEVILVDDGSTDGSPAICDEYAKNDKRVKVIHKENGGHSSARNEGVKNCVGEYVVFIDSDDYVSNQYLEVFVEQIEKNCIDFISVGYVMTDEQSQKNCIINYLDEKFYNRDEVEKNIFPFLLEDINGNSFPTTLCACSIKKDLIVNILSTIDSRVIIGEDAICTEACIYKSQSVSIVKKCLYYYRQNPNSIMHSKIVRTWTEFELRLKTIKEIINLDEFDFFEQYKRAAVHILFNVVLSQFNRKEKYSKIVREIKMQLKNPEYKKLINECKTKSLKLRIARFLLKYKLFLIIKFCNFLKNS